MSPHLGLLFAAATVSGFYKGGLVKIKNHTFFRFLSLFLCLTLIVNCGGSSSSSSDTSNSVTLTGTVSVPVSGLANISALTAFNQIEPNAATAVEYGEIAALIAVVVIGSLTLLGQPISNKFENVSQPVDPVGTTDAGFEFVINKDDLNAGDIVIVEAETADGEKVAKAYQVEEDDIENGEVNLEEVNLDSSLAWEDLKAQMEESFGVPYAQWSESDISQAEFSFDIGCNLKMGEAKWEISSEMDDGLGADLTLMKNLVAAASLTDEVEGSLTEITEDLLKGDLTDTQIAVLAEAASENFGGNAEDYQNSIANILVDNDAIEGVYQESIAAIDSSENLCDSLKTDPEFLEETMKVMMNFDDTDILTTTFGSDEGLGAYMDFMANYQDENSDFSFENTDVKWDSAVFSALFETYATEGTLTSFSSEIEQLTEIMMQIPEDVDDSFDYEDWGAVLTAQYLEDPEVFDAEQVGGYWTYQVETIGFELGDTSLDDVDLTDIFDEASVATGGFDYSTCVTDPTTCETSLEVYSDDLMIDGFEYEAADELGLTGVNGTQLNGTAIYL